MPVLSLKNSSTENFLHKNLPTNHGGRLFLSIKTPPNFLRGEVYISMVTNCQTKNDYA